MSEPILKCDDCGTEDNVSATHCPFLQEIYEIEEPCQVCEECYHQRCLEI